MSTELTGPALSSAKKRKHGELRPDGTKASRKKAKLGKKTKKKKDTDEDCQFQVVDASIVLSIPPLFARDPMAGAKELLDSLLMRYVAGLGGVLLCHSNAKFLSPTASIKYECPFLICDVGFEATVWSPRIGMKLTGSVNICSPDHISLLVFETFNISIPRHHIPENWVFEHGAAENDPEFQPERVEYDGNGELISEVERGGEWVHSALGEKIGGIDGKLEFTVVGLTVANQMLSLVASLQPDPFSPAHVPKSAIASAENEPAAEAEAPAELPELSDEDDLEDDPFESLSRARKKATERAAKTVAEPEHGEKEEKRKKKREKQEKREKRKAEEAGITGLPNDSGAVKEKKKRKRKKDTQEG